MIRCSDEHKVAIREMTDERSDNDSGDDEQSEESNNARSSMATLTTPTPQLPTTAHPSSRRTLKCVSKET